MRYIILPLTAALIVAGCSSEAGDASARADTQASQAPTPKPTPTPIASAGGKTLTLEELGGLTIGQPVPKNSSFTAAEGQIGNGCETLSSPQFPDVYAIRTNGEVRRISVFGDSDVKLVEGVGPGSAIEDVRSAFPGFVEEPHKYTGPEGKYLTQPGNDPRLRFEIDPDGTVSTVHVGVMPELGYVEGCA